MYRVLNLSGYVVEDLTLLELERTQIDNVGRKVHEVMLHGL